jgi:hypothetical protein
LVDLVNDDAAGTLEEDGVLLFSNEDFLNHPVDVVRRKIIDRLAKQVYFCPRSLVVFDEVGRHQCGLRFVQQRQSCSSIVSSSPSHQ